jgi:hypothetical protein
MEDLSVVQSTGSLFHKFFNNLNISVLKLIKFVLKYGEHNVAQDGDLKWKDRNVADVSDGDCQSYNTAVIIRAN